MKPDLLGVVITKAAAFLKRGEAALTAEVFQILLNPVKESLYNFIFKTSNYSEDAGDIYQETILRAFKYRESYRHQHSFKTWIFTIAHNEIKSFFNKNKKLPAAMGLEEQLDVADEPGNEDGTLVREIYEVAGELTPQQRRVFFLFYDQQFSIREIHEITSLKEGNIKFILNQAREKIKQKLGVKNG